MSFCSIAPLSPLSPPDAPGPEIAGFVVWAAALGPPTKQHSVISIARIETEPRSLMFPLLRCSYRWSLIYWTARRLTRGPSSIDPGPIVTAEWPVRLCWSLDRSPGCDPARRHNDKLPVGLQPEQQPLGP